MKSSYYEELTVETFHEFVSSDTSMFVMFYSPTCPHCKAWSMMPSSLQGVVVDLV